jgi:hypothetical protein
MNTLFIWSSGERAEYPPHRTLRHLRLINRRSGRIVKDVQSIDPDEARLHGEIIGTRRTISMSILKSTALAAILAAASLAPATSFAQSNTSTIVQGGENSLNTGVTSQRGRNNDALTVQEGTNSDNLAVTDQRGCRNVAAVGQGGRNSVNSAGVAQAEAPNC